jgi:hypothetical protein
MGTILASAIITKARDILQDTSAIRWTDAEALRWLSEGQRYITLQRPDASAVVANITMVAGTKQTLPATAMRLLDVTRNMGVGGATPGAPIRIVDREVLDAQVADWHTKTGVTSFQHYVYDQRNPKSFYIYPPASGTSPTVEAIYTVVPAELAAVGNAINIDDIYEPVMLDYLLYRALSKNAEYAGNMERAVMYMQACNGALGVKAQIDIATSPNKNAPPYNPNSAGGMR